MFYHLIVRQTFTNINCKCDNKYFQHGFHIFFSLIPSLMLFCIGIIVDKIGCWRKITFLNGGYCNFFVSNNTIPT